MFFKIKKRALFRFLENADSEMIQSIGRKKVLRAFKRAGDELPIYKKILEKNNLKTKDVKNLENFEKKVPIIYKKDIFNEGFRLEDFYIGDLEEIEGAYTSSGFSGNFSYGIFTKKDTEKGEAFTRLLFDKILDTEDKKPLMINALAMGVDVPSPYTKINTSVRPDMVLAFIELFKEKYDQFIIFSDPFFAKEIVDYAIERGFDWKKVRASFVCGGAWTSESLVNYIYEKAEMKKTGGKYLMSMGISEIGLLVFQMPDDLTEIRKEIQNNEKLKKELFGNIRAVPELMYYFPMNHYIEVINADENGFGELVFSCVDKGDKSPLIRYNSKDVGKLISNKDFKETLKKHNCSVPRFNLPLVGVFGRTKRNKKIGKNKLSVCDAEQKLFEDIKDAEKITGYFKVTKKGVKIQLKKGLKKSKNLEKKFEKRIGFKTILYEYDEFPYGLEINYEKKFKLI